MIDGEMFVICTGTRHILFSTQQQFIDFYSRLSGRYINILSAITIGDKYYIDQYGSPLYELHHYKYGIYSRQTDGSDNKEYKGIIINPDYTIPDDWTVSFDKRLLLTNEKYKESVITKNGLSFKSPEYTLHQDVDFELFMKDFDVNGNNFLMCFNEPFEKFNRPRRLKFNICDDYKKRCHSFSFYRFVLSEYVYGLTSKMKSLKSKSKKSLKSKSKKSQ